MAGALDADHRLFGAVLDQPRLKPSRSGAAVGHAQHIDLGAAAVDQGGHVDVLVGIDADEHARLLARHG